jgi:hypothetical protein
MALISPQPGGTPIMSRALPCSVAAGLAIVLLAAGGHTSAGADRPGFGPSWQEVFADRLPAYGHRNWIAVVDSAYPAQTSAGIETVVTDADQLDVLKQVLDALGQTKHVRPVIYLDAELPLVEERDARGITKYRRDLDRLLDKREVKKLPHEQIIDRLDKSGEKFKVLVLKTNLALPYTSVFMQLECGYWGDDAEKRLRAKMAGEGKQP